MQSMPSVGIAPTASITARPLSPTSLSAAFAQVPDPRRQASVSYALPAILGLALAAILSNQQSVLAIAEWGARQRQDLLHALGFPNGQTPCQSTLQRLFRQLDGAALSATLSAHFGLATVPLPGERVTHGIAIDGKAQRGRLQYAAGGCPVHALSAFCHEQGIVLAHEPIEQGAEKAEAELTVAPDLIARIDWRGRVLTGDALFCQRRLCRQVQAAGGDYLLLVKDNQPNLLHDIALLFDPPADTLTLPLLDRREVATIERGHGRSHDRRHLLASTDLSAYLDWPGLAQVFRLERSWRVRGVTKRTVHYGITSLAPETGSPARLLALKRGHWSIENRLHRVKDVTFGEDQSLVHQGQGPLIMALLRDAAISVLHRAGIQRITARLRYHSQYPHAAIALVVGSPPTHA